MNAARLMGRAAVFSIAFAALTQAQQIPFRLVVNQQGSAATVQNGATVSFNAPTGQAQTAQVTATYSGTSQAVIAQQPAVLGSTAFTVTLGSALPITLPPGAAFSFEIQFRPATAQNNANLTVAYTEAGSPGGNINLQLQGMTPAFIASYVLQSDQNTVPLNPGGAIVFPATPVNTTAQAVLNITNRGSGPGTVTGIAISGQAFKLQNLPLFPVSVAAGANLQVTVLYQPTGVVSSTGQIQITFDTGPPLVVGLQGVGSAPSLLYELLDTNPPAPVAPGGTVMLPDTSVGQTSTAVIRIRNAGTANGVINSVSLVGQGFQLINPPILPQTLATNASLTLTIAFTPGQPANLKGSLFINSDTLNLVGQGLGPQFSFSYVAGGNTITLGGTNPSVVFSPVMVSQSGQVAFDVKNTGTTPAILSNIGIGEAKSPFALSGLPALPLTLDPGADAPFTITVTPITVGFSTGTLRLDTTTVQLVGSGTQPPPLPAYTITGPTGTTPPMSQPAIGLKLASPYPVAIAGVLTIGASGDLPGDPGVQFATGGTTTPFVIPANATDAMFGALGSQIRLQTGTVSSTITLTPSFTTQAGGVDLTPAGGPTTLQFSVAPAAPTLISIKTGSITANGFVLTVTGFSTTRSLSNLNVQFTPTADVTVATAQFSIDVGRISQIWFQSNASVAFGGQFSISVPFSFQGTPPEGKTLLGTISSLSVTASNSVGTSNSLTAAIQ
jgi:hypothetical protein